MYERDALETIVARARAFKAERDPAVTITEPTTEDYGTIRIYNTHIGYLLPFEVEVQFYECVGRSSGALAGASMATETWVAPGLRAGEHGRTGAGGENTPS